MSENQEKRMVGDTGYQVKHAIHVGDKEIVFAEDENAKGGMCWLVGDYTHNDIISQYADCRISDDFLETMQEFADRVSRQITAMWEEKTQSATCAVFSAEQCYPHDYGQDINGKVVAIKAEVLRPEYRRGDVQLVLVNGGNGARGDARGSAVFCYELNNGQLTRYERQDVLGEVKPEYLPQWAKDKAAALQHAKAAPPQKKPKERGDR